MTARTGWTFVRHVFPGPWLSALGAVLCMTTLGLLAFAAARIPDGGMPLFFLQGAALIAAGWWLLLGSRLCSLVYRMVPLRLPGIARTLRRGVLLHLLLSIGLPLLALSWWQPTGVDGWNLAGALWLGSSVGLLIVSMPMAIPLVPLALIALDWSAVADPALCGLLGSAALLLSALAWRWQLGGIRSAFLAPMGVELGGSPLQWLQLLREQPSASALAHAPHGTGRRQPVPPSSSLDLLAACLGPSCQTFRQLYGRRGQWLTYLIFACTTLALLVGARLLPAGGDNNVLAVMLAAALMLAVQSPANRLLALQRQRRGELATLQLIPGMPPAADLPVALMRQIVRCLGERVALMALALPAAAALSYSFGWDWLVWWACLALLALAQGVASAWLAWHGQSRNWWWVGTLTLGTILAIATNVHWLTSARPQPLLWFMVWAGWITLAVVVFGSLQRRKTQHIAAPNANARCDSED